MQNEKSKEVKNWVSRKFLEIERNLNVKDLSLKEHVDNLEREIEYIIENLENYQSMESFGYTKGLHELTNLLLNLKLVEIKDK